MGMLSLLCYLLFLWPEKIEGIVIFYHEPIFLRKCLKKCIVDVGFCLTCFIRTFWGRTETCEFSIGRNIYLGLRLATLGNRMTFFVPCSWRYQLSSVKRKVSGSVLGISLLGNLKDPKFKSIFGLAIWFFKKLCMYVAFAHAKSDELQAFLKQKLCLDIQ